MIRVLFVDDHEMVRIGVSAYLSSLPDIEVIGEAENGLKGVEMALSLKPDVILMDLVMPEMDGIEATKQIREKMPEVKILILTSMLDQDHAIPALEAGASGYLLKESDPDELLLAIKKVINGETYIHSKITTGLMTALHSKRNPEHTPLETLTQREKEVLKEITKGKSNKEIASSLYITEKTVKTHVSNILSKLNLQDRTQAALYAIRNGF